MYSSRSHWYLFADGFSGRHGGSACLVGTKCWRGGRKTSRSRCPSVRWLPSEAFVFVLRIDVEDVGWSGVQIWGVAICSPWRADGDEGHSVTRRSPCTASTSVRHPCCLSRWTRTLCPSLVDKHLSVFLRQQGRGSFLLLLIVFLFFLLSVTLLFHLFSHNYLACVSWFVVMFPVPYKFVLL